LQDIQTTNPSLDLGVLIQGWIMDVVEVDLCIVNGFRLTEYKVYEGGDIVDTYYNIRDEQGTAHGRDYGNIETPLDIIISMLPD